MDQYSTNTISRTLLEEIAQALKNVSPNGSVEIYVQDNVVTQITVINIKKTISRQNIKPVPSMKGRMVAQSL